MSRGANLWRVLAQGLTVVACTLLAACGGGGGGGGTSLPAVTGSTATTSAATTAPVTSSGAGTGTTVANANMVSISIDTGPAGATGQVNIPYVTVTVCAPDGASGCQTIDHVILDTGSIGLRLLASALANRSVLPAESDASGQAFAECAQFASGYTWGSVRMAGIRVGGESAASVPIQLIGDPDVAAIPATCGTSGPEQDTVAALGGKGLLGVGAFRQDCGSACESAAVSGRYYSCPAGADCNPVAMAATLQVSNPVPFFSTDNNGVLVQLPAIAAAGATNVTGQLLFGIGTRSNNAMGSAQAYATDGNGAIQVTVDGQVYADAYVDSGSNFLFFDSSVLPACTAQSYTRFYCPSSATSLGVTVVGTNGATGAFNLQVADAVSTLNAAAGGTAFDDIAAADNMANRFDFGLPFFFGRSVFVAIEGASTPAGVGPYVGF